MSRWQKVRLGDITSKVGSGATPTGGANSYKDNGISLIRSQNVLDLSLTKNGLVYIDDNQACKLNNVIVESGDILLNITGDSVARVCIVMDEVLPARVNQHVAIIRVDSAIINNKFLLYTLLNMKPHLLCISGIGGTRNALTKKMIEDLEIELPSLTEQERIARILGALDDKIELNKRINGNLEAQAQALFRRCFVDFEFPDTDGKPYRSSGGEMIDSPLGEIPKDWSVGKLTEIADYLNGLAMQKCRPLDNEVGIPVLKIKELGNKKCDFSSDLCSESIKKEYIVNDGDVIFSWSGTLMIDIWCGGKCGLNQHLFKVTSKNYPKWFYYFWTAYHLDKFIRIAKDKAVTMGHIKREDLHSSEVLIPNNETFFRMSELMQPMLDQQIVNNLENKSLAELRNSLLPKLMNNELH